MVNEELRVALDEEILREIGKLDGMKPGSNEHTDAVRSITEMYRTRVDEESNETEATLKAEQLKDAAEAEKQAKKDRWWTLAANGMLSLVTIGLTFAHENGLAMKCLKFEESGSFQSVISKGLFGKVLRKR